MRFKEILKEDDYWGEYRDRPSEDDDTAALAEWLEEWVDGEFGIPPGFSDVSHRGTVIRVGIKPYQYDKEKTSRMRAEWVQTGEDLIDYLPEDFGEWTVSAAGPFSVTLEKAGYE